MLKKLRLKFVCITMVLVLVMLGTIFALVVHFTAESLESESMALLQRVAGEPYTPNAPNETVGEVRLPYFTLQIDRYGNLVVAGETYYDLTDTAFLTELLEHVISAGSESGVIAEYSLRYYVLTTYTAQYMVFADMSSEIATLNSLKETCALIGGACFLVLLGISLLLARWAVKPVERAWNQQRQFVADASHELKTPLTVITTNAELLESETYDEAQRAQLRDNILVMSQRMRLLVESLLQLARADNRQTALERSAVDYSTLISDAILPFEPVFFEKGLTLTSHVEAGISVRGSEEQLRKVADILLDNAQKYSLGEVTLLLRRQGRGHCLLSVTSSGAPLSAQERKDIFKRFYRIDDARTGGSGYGLGLPIAQSIVGEHGGKIWAQSENGWNTFFVQLPTQ